MIFKTMISACRDEDSGIGYYIIYFAVYTIIRTPPKVQFTPATEDIVGFVVFRVDSAFERFMGSQGKPIDKKVG